MTRVMGRDPLLEEVRDLLARGEAVALCGTAGVGRSALLDEIEERARSRHGAEVLRCSGAAEDAARPGTALRDLLAQCPPDLVDTSAMEPGGEPGDRLRSVLEAWSATRPVLLLLDDAQWFDVESAVAVGYARRRLRGRVAVVASAGTDGLAGPGLSGFHHLDVEPLADADLVDLLCGQGLSADVAQRVAVECGGIPALALAMAGAVGARPTVLGVPTPLPPSLTRVLRQRLDDQPEEVLTTLVTAALLHRPSIGELERAGRLGAADDVRAAERAGLVSVAESGVRFTPSVLRAIVVTSVPAEQRATLHRGLAAVAPSGATRLRHLALAAPTPDARLAGQLADAAEGSAEQGARELATELFVLAAERAPRDLATQRIEWWVRAAETGAPGNHVELVQRALAAVLDDAVSPEQAVRLRLAIPELAGHGVPLLDEVLSAALADAGDDDALVAQVLLQRARIALRESRPGAAREAAERAVGLIEGVGSEEELALALTTLAAARRWLAAPHEEAIARAVRLAGPTPTGFLHVSPEYMAARFAFYDDRLEEAWTAFVTMLGRVEREAGMDHVHVLRCLVEVAARSGRCREALEYAERAARIGAAFDIDAYAGWFITAQAEVVGGDLARARTLAERGVEAAEEVGDERYRQRHLILLGHVLLRTGDAHGAREALEQVRRLERAGGYGDPTVNRWHADLVVALVSLGRLEDATEVLGEARYALERRSATAGVAAQLDRAEAELLLAGGDLDAADALLDRATKLSCDLGLRIDEGRTLISRAHLERRRRRVAAARGALQRAADLFDHLHAATWAAQVRSELEPESLPQDGVPLLGRLTEAETRIALAVADGSSNREIAERAYVSVKTVEATLTRIYRKLELRSRTQLAGLLREAVTDQAARAPE